MTEDEVTQALMSIERWVEWSEVRKDFLKILRDNFGMNKSEYRRMLYLSLMRAKVSQEVDEPANKLSQEVEKILAEQDGNLTAAAELGAGVTYEETGRLVDNMNVDGGGRRWQ